MPDTLAQMEEKLAGFEKDLEFHTIEFSKATSAGGTSITPEEQALLNEIEQQIATVKKYIYAKVKSNVKIDNVLDRYTRLFRELLLFLSSEIDTNYLNGCKIVLDAGSCYAIADNNFETAMDAQKQHLQDIANIKGNIISILGGGAMSWLFTTKSVAINIGRFSEKANEYLNNAVEDAVQIGFDKVVSYAAPKLPSYPAPSRQIPQVFQNKLSKQLIDAHIKMREKVIEQLRIVHALMNALEELKIERKGNALAEYKRFVEIESIVHKTFREVRVLMANSPKPIDQTLVQREFERAMWAKWLPSLRYMRTVGGYNDEFGVPSPVADMKVEDHKASLARALKNRLIALNITKESGAEIDAWTSTEDSKKLVAWGKSYTLKQLF